MCYTNPHMDYVNGSKFNLDRRITFLSFCMPLRKSSLRDSMGQISPRPLNYF
jgi:hypothetical protein